LRLEFNVELPSLKTQLFQKASKLWNSPSNTVKP